MKTSDHYPEPWGKNNKPYGSPWTKNPYDSSLDEYKKWVEKPKVITISDLFPRLDRLSIGWSPLLDQLKEITNNKPSYPPYDIVALKDDVTLLNVAVAGFNKNEVSVTVKDSAVTIEGQKEDKQEGDIVYQGIATRDFKFTLAIAEYWEVTNAVLDNGMLTVQFNKNLPEEKKPKVIPIK
jgi:molecular chaperone IbpA